MSEYLSSDNSLEINPSNLYAAVRNLLYRQGKAIEILVSYTPSMNIFIEWWKQLFGESEGKDDKGIFPAGVNFTTDLHSMGQWIQEGTRNIFETVIWIENSSHNLYVPTEKRNLDELNYLAGKKLNEINQKAMLGTSMAHVDGGVPNILISIPKLNEYYLGMLIYFFEKACAVSGYMLGVNPFNQPGVETYKKNMFSLLGKKSS
jgi:glucose-6-phosphate isomerase